MGLAVWICGVGVCSFEGGFECWVRDHASTADKPNTAASPTHANQEFVERINRFLIITILS